MVYVCIIAVFCVGPICGVTYAQEPDSALCNTIKSDVVLPLKPLRMGAERMWENECNFNLWYSTDRKLAVYVEQYESNAKASEEFARFSRILPIYDKPVLPPRTPYQPINSNKHWNEAIAYKNEKSGHFMLLRINHYLVTLISSDYGLLTKAETLFRAVHFESFRN